MMKKDVSAGIIIKRSKNNTPMLLLIKRSPDDNWPLQWEVPRGKCESGENRNECLIREVKEETGLDVISEKFIGKFKYIADNGTRETTQYNYLCRLKNPKQEIRLSREHAEYRWVTSFAEVELMVNPELKKIVAQVFDNNMIVDYEQDDIIEEALNRYLERL